MFAEFQSHEPEFDYLKSLEIEEKINQITFCRPVNGAVFLLSTNGARARAQRARATPTSETRPRPPPRRASNSLVLRIAPAPSPLSPDKTIKLWKISNKRLRTVTPMNLNGAGAGSTASSAAMPLRLPRVEGSGSVVAATPRRVYANAHAYHINSMSLNSDGETFISSDDLRINLWNLEINDRAFSE